MVVAAVEQIPEIRQIDAPAHEPGGTGDQLIRPGALFRRGIPVRHFGQDPLAPRGAGFDEEVVPAVRADLRQREVEPPGGARARTRRRAEAAPARPCAVHRHDEGVSPAVFVRAVNGGLPKEDDILDGDRRQVAGADTDKGIARRGLRLRRHARRLVAVGRDPEQARPGRKEERFPGHRAHRMGEERGVGGPAEAVATRLLVVHPAGGEILRGLDLGADDGPVADGRPDHGVAVAAERAEQGIEVCPMEECGHLRPQSTPRPDCASSGRRPIQPSACGWGL